MVNNVNEADKNNMQKPSEATLINRANAAEKKRKDDQIHNYPHKMCGPSTYLKCKAYMQYQSCLQCM